MDNLHIAAASLSDASRQLLEAIERKASIKTILGFVAYCNRSADMLITESKLLEGK